VACPFQRIWVVWVMKTTVEISDSLLDRAKKRALIAGRSLRALIGEALRRVLQHESKRSGYRLADRSVGRSGGHNPLAARPWQDLRGEIYGDDG
jgi:hypothetical protein